MEVLLFQLRQCADKKLGGQLDQRVVPTMLRFVASLLIISRTRYPLFAKPVHVHLCTQSFLRCSVLFVFIACEKTMGLIECCGRRYSQQHDKNLHVRSATIDLSRTMSEWFLQNPRCLVHIFKLMLLAMLDFNCEPKQLREMNQQYVAEHT